MFDLFKRYVDEGYIRFDRGDMWFGKERLIFYYTQFSAIELSINSRIGGWKYLAAKFVASREEGRLLIQQHGAPSMKELDAPLNAILKVMEILGIGTFKIVTADSGRGLAVLTGVSTLGLETKDVKASATPIDFVIGGIMAGVVGYYAKRQTYAVELSCVSQKGVNACTWVVGDRQGIMDYIQKASPDKVEWGNRTLDQTEAMEKELGGSDGLRGIVNLEAV